MNTSAEGRQTVTHLSKAAGSEALSAPQPLRVLHIISDLCVAGAEMKLYKLLAATDRTRFAPTVIAMRSQGELRERIEALGIPVHTLGVWGSLPGPVSVARLIQIVRRVRPELIHGWMYHGNLAAQFAAAFSQTKPTVIWSVHQSLYTFAFEKALTAAVIKLCARISALPAKIVYPSQASARQHEAIGYRREKSVTIHYGFDTERFAPSTEARRSVCQELNLPREALLIGLVARYHPIKDHTNFFRAAALVLKSRPEARFILCGKGIDESNTALRKLIQQQQLSASTFLMGERPDMHRIMAALDIAVSSSHSEGFPNVVAEAMSSGVPCVATAVSDLAEIVGKTGLIVPPGDPAILAEAIDELIKIGPTERKSLGAAARARIIDRYSLELSVARYEAIYEGLTVHRKTEEQPGRMVARAVGGTS